MPRKPSIILSVEEKRAKKKELRTNLTTAKAHVKEAEKTLREATRNKARAERDFTALAA